MSDHERFMRVAIEEAKTGAAMGEQPFGAVVVRDGEVVVRARSLKVSTSDTLSCSSSAASAGDTVKVASRPPDSA